MSGLLRLTVELAIPVTIITVVRPRFDRPQNRR
jgi:hypothetical protein